MLRRGPFASTRDKFVDAIRIRLAVGLPELDEALDVVFLKHHQTK